MAAITDLSELINLATGGNNGSPDNQWFGKIAKVGVGTLASPIIGQSTSLWTYEGTYGFGSVPPAAGEAPTRSTNGAIPFVAPGGSREKWLIQIGATANTTGVVILYDRLFHDSGLSGTSTADQTVQGDPPSPAISRYTDGVGNQAFYEIYTQIGSTATTLTMTYTDDAGNTGQTSTTTIGGTNNQRAQTIHRIPVASGDKGVRAIEKIKLTATTGTAGDFGIVIAKPLAYIPLSGASILGMRDYATGLPGIPKVDADACLFMVWHAGTTTVPELFGCCSFVEK